MIQDDGSHKPIRRDCTLLDGTLVTEWCDGDLSMETTTGDLIEIEADCVSGLVEFLSGYTDEEAG